MEAEYPERELDFRAVLDLLAAGEGEEVLLLAYERREDATGIVLELRGRLGPLETAAHGTEDDHPDGYRTAARFEVGPGALNLHAVDFDRAREAGFGWVVIDLREMRIEVRGLPNQ